MKQKVPPFKGVTVWLGLSLPGGRREVRIRPHRRLWLYWWKVLRREAGLASTLTLKRRRGRWYAVFVFDLAPKKETPAEVVAFDVNENWVAVARLSLLSTVDAVARWSLTCCGEPPPRGG
jgi:putative transposase